jgi:hypothetical protein
MQHMCCTVGFETLTQGLLVLGERQGKKENAECYEGCEEGEHLIGAV